LDEDLELQESQRKLKEKDLTKQKALDKKKRMIEHEQERLGTIEPADRELLRKVLLKYFFIFNIVGRKSIRSFKIFNNH
jgi:hypothetical protein